MTLEFRSLSHAYDQPVLREISLSAQSGSVMCLLGPSGCGKTTLFRLAAGLVPVQQGEILLGGALLADASTNPPPEKRPVGLVFQEGALFPHMSVAQNIGFAAPPEARRELVTQWLERTNLIGYERRLPHTLSGGQQQRVALARALVARPQVVLLDEPFGGIDVLQRQNLRQETREILKDSGATVIHVTHDPVEAFEMGDQIAVLEKGRIVQAGDPAALYGAPKSKMVASLLGDCQFLRGQLDGDLVRTAFGDWPLALLANTPNAAQIDLAIRPGDLVISAARFERTDTHPLIKIEAIRLIGAMRQLTARAPNGDVLRLNEYAPSAQPIEPGSDVQLSPTPKKIHAFTLDNNS